MSSLKHSSSINGVEQRPAVQEELQPEDAGLRFEDCLVEVEAILADVQNCTASPIISVLTLQISSRVSDASSMHTLLNAEQVLKDIDEAFSQARDGPAAEVFKDGVLDLELGNLMNFIHDLKEKKEAAEAAG